MKSKTLSEIVGPVRPDQIVAHDEFVRVAIERLQSNKTGCVCIMDASSRPIGIFTDGDVRRLVYNGANASLAAVFAYKVDKFANHSMRVGSPEMTCLEAARLMHELRIGALPVVSSSTGLVGIISLQDVLGELLAAI